MRLEVGNGKPLAVDSSAKVDNLNFDRVDGKDSSALMPAKTYVVEHEESIEPPTSAISRAILCDDGDVPISGGFGSLDPESRIISSRQAEREKQREAFLGRLRAVGKDPTAALEAMGS